MENIENTSITISGQIIYKRVFGKKLEFLHLICENEIETEVMLKDSPYVLTTKVGQIVKVEGNFHMNKNERLMFLPKKLEIIEKNDQYNYYIDRIRKSVHIKSRKPIEERCICKNYKKFKICLEKHCLLRHYLLEGEEERLKILLDKKTEAFNKVHENDPHIESSKLKKIQRSRLFAEFVVEKFGIEFLKSGHVLDIAGGKGIYYSKK